MKLNLKLTCLSLAVVSAFACVTPAIAQDAASDTRPGHHVLPIWGDELAAKGYDVPEPFGINVNYMNIRQNVGVDQIDLSNLAINPGVLAGQLPKNSPLSQILAPLNGLGVTLPNVGIPLPNNLFSIQTGNTRMRSFSTTVKIDAWVLPFLNVYALAGKTQGHSVSQVSVNLNQPVLQGTIANIMSSGLASGMENQVKAAIENGVKNGTIPAANVPAITSAMAGSLANLPAAINDAISNMVPKGPSDIRLNFKGATYGGGVVLAGGYKNVFGLVDANFTQTRFDVLDGHINTFTLSPRVGYRFNIPGSDAMHLPQSRLSVWVGGMYQNTQQTYRGKVSDLQVSGPLQPLFMMAGRDAHFEVRQHLSDPWNVLVGAEYAITRNFNITTEIGFAHRNSVLVSGEFRF